MWRKFAGNELFVPSQASKKRGREMSTEFRPSVEFDPEMTVAQLKKLFNIDFQNDTKNLVVEMVSSFLKKIDL